MMERNKIGTNRLENSSQFLALFETFQWTISDSVHYSFPKTLHIAPKELLTLSQAQNPQSTDRGFLISLFKNLISSTHPRHHPLKELRGRHVVSIQFFVLE